MIECDLVEQFLVESFSKVFPNLSPEEILTASETTVEDWSSLTVVNLILIIEDKFKITVDLDRISEFTSYNSIFKYLLSLI